MKLMDKAEAKKALSVCDLSNKSKFKDYVKKDIANIFAEDPKPAAAKTAATAAIKTAKTHEVVETKEYIRQYNFMFYATRFSALFFSIK